LRCHTIFSIKCRTIHIFLRLQKMTIKVTERGDGSFDIDWDEKDPVESIMNEWTEEDFIKALQEYIEQHKKNKLE